MFIEKLESSGLTLEDGRILKISEVSNLKTSKLCKSFKALTSMKIDYYGPDKEPLPDWPEAKPFYRVRYLDEANDFASLTDKKIPRYAQEPNTAPVCYYPQNQDWSKIIEDPDQPIIITEGELKSAKACKEGFPCIGLGGVYNFRAHKLGITWLPSLDFINWVKRNVYICFDSDYQTNPMVCHALKSLAEALHEKGSFCHLVTLPQLPNMEKVGIDDFLVHAGPSANEMFGELLSGAEPLGLTAPLWKLNDKYVYVQNPGIIVVQGSMHKVTPGAFRDHVESTCSYQERQIKADGSVSYKSVSASSAWLRWPLRKEVLKLTYIPGAEEFTDNMFNIWPGWGVEPKKGDVKPFLELLDHLFTGAEEGAKDWFLKWCAYPIQHPGTKLFSSVVLHGIRHGTGKSLVGYTIGRIYGKNFTEISQVDLHNTFNEWAESKQFVMGDDVTGSNKRAENDFLKKLITQLEIRINGKYVPTYVIPDCVNYLFTANQPDSFFLEDDDRRMFIHEVVVQPLGEDFYAGYMAWLNNGGAPALFHYLKELDLKGFNPAAPAFKTYAKDRMIEKVRSDLAEWVRQLQATPEQVLRVGDITVDKDLMTTKEILLYYDVEGNKKATANGLGREMSRAGFRQVYDGRPVRLKDGSQNRYYIIKGPWNAKSKINDIVDYLNGGNND